MINLFRCEPLNASITPKQCQANKQRDVFACDKCEGLGMPVQLQPIKETKDMARPAIKPILGIKKGDYFDCPGCGKHLKYESGGLCGGCNQKRRMEKKQTDAPANNAQETHEQHTVDVWEPIEQLSDPAPADSVPANFGKVKNGDGELVSFGVDELIWQALEDAWAAKKHEWMVDLSGVKATSQICRCAAMIKAVEQLGY